MQTVIVVAIAAGIFVVLVILAYYCYRRHGRGSDEEESAIFTEGSDDAYGSNVSVGSSGYISSSYEEASAYSSGRPAKLQPFRYRIKKLVGEGAYGSVYLAVRKRNAGVSYSSPTGSSSPRRADEEQVAIKVIPCKDTAEGNEAWKEYTMCLQLKGHPNVITVLDVFFDAPAPNGTPSNVKHQATAGSDEKNGSSVGSPVLPPEHRRIMLQRLGIPYNVFADQYLIIVTNYYPAGTLFDKLAVLPAGSGLPESTIWLWTEQLFRALHFIHDKNIIHRDLKPSNVLLGEDGNLALTDFGLSKLVEMDEYAKTRTGTLQYMSPEQVERRYNNKADIWGVGCLMYAMCTAKVSTASAKMMFRDRMRADFEDVIRQDCSTYYSPALIDFMLRLLSKTASNRPTAEQAARELAVIRRTFPTPS